MSALLYLIRAKFFARVRNIYRKPVSAIITTLGILCYIVFFVMQFVIQGNSTITSQVYDAQISISIYTAFVILIAVTMSFQKRTSLLTGEDAANILTGPFSQRTVLKYIVIGTFQNSLLFSLGTSLYLVFFSYLLNLNFLSLLLMMIGGFGVFYFVFVGVDYFYLMSIANPKFNTIKKIFYSSIVLIIFLIVAYYFVAANFDFAILLNNILSSTMLDAIPIFGWFRLGASSFIQGDYLWFVIAFGGILLADILLTYTVIDFRYDFYEQINKDAEWYTTIRAQVKEGRYNAGETTGKVREVNMASFGIGARAISSNIFLQMKKTNNWIKKSDLILTIFYLAIAYFGQLGFTFFQYYILIIVFTTINSDSIMRELKQPYIYLIPDKPLKKLIHLLLPMTVKTGLLVIISLILACLAFQASVGELLSAILTTLGYALVLIAGSVWSIRLLKSRSNAVSESFIKMFIIILSLVPAVGVSLWLFAVMGEANPHLMNAITAVSLLTNIVVGTILILLAKSLLNGTNIMAE